jgi:hypothetical protein
MLKVGDVVKILYPDYMNLLGILRDREEFGRWLVQLSADCEVNAAETILLSLDESEFERVEAEIGEIE